MFDETVSPRIMEQGSGKMIRHLVMKFFGTGESDMEPTWGNDRQDRQPRVGITVSKATISPNHGYGRIRRIL